MKTKLVTITLLICGGLLLASFQSNPDGPTAIPEENLTTTGDVLSVQLLKPDTLSGDHLTNYPEPFYTQTTIEYEIIQSTWVTLIIKCPDNKLQILAFGNHEPGTYFVTFDACNKPCGCYTASLMTHYETEVEVMNKVRSMVAPRPIID